jgi:hypothetical protein
VRRLEGFIVVENGRVITTVVIFVSLHEKTVGKHPAAVAKQQIEKIIRLAAFAFQQLKPHLQIGGKAETKNEQRY